MSRIALVPLKDIEATRTLAQKLASVLNGRDILLLQGDLGAGKTTFARFLLEALGHEGDTPSPTFTLVQSYETPKATLFHFDLYRLKEESEVEEIGFDEACSEGMVLVEWPEKAKSYMPRGALTLLFDGQGNGKRQVIFDGGPLWASRLEGFF